MNKQSKCCAKCSCECLKTFEEYISASQEGNEQKYSLKMDHGGFPKPSNSKKSMKKQNAGVELVPLLARRRGDPKNNSLSTTDVTKMDKFNPG